MLRKCILIICIYLGFGHRKNVLLNSPDSGKFVFAQMKSRWICDFIGNWSDNLKKKSVLWKLGVCIADGVHYERSSSKGAIFYPKKCAKKRCFFNLFFYRFDRSGRHFEFFVVVVITHN